MVYQDFSIRVSKRVARFDGKTIGRVEGDTLERTARGSKHMLRSPRGWAFEVQVLRQAMAVGANWVRLTDLETGKVYLAAMATIWAKGVVFNRGYGEQIVLPLPEWKVEGQPEQMALFAV